MNYDNLAMVSASQLNQMGQVGGWQAQYRLIIQWSDLISRKSNLRKQEYLMKGCETSAWLTHEIYQGCNRFAFDSDSRVMNGLMALLLSMIDGKRAEQLEALNFNIILRDLGFAQYLSPSRNNGLRIIIMKAYAMAGCVCYGLS